MILIAIQKIFGNIRYVLLAGVIAVGIFLFTVWYPNFSLIKSILSDTTISVESKVSLPFKLLGSIATNFTVASALYAIFIALLAGVNIAIVAYLVFSKSGARNTKEYIMGLLGVGGGVVGIGCAACGSLLIPILLGTGSGILAFLPWQGREFGIIGLIFLATSTYLLLKKSGDPMICAMKK